MEAAGSPGTTAIEVQKTLGRARSFVGAARRALDVRDHGCSHASRCDAPLERCQGDDVIAWSRGGLTNPDNGHSARAAFNQADLFALDRPVQLSLGYSG
jgi:hypothetical protein